MQATPTEAGPGKDPLEQLAALDRLLEEAKKLIRAQEQEVERLRAAGFDLRRAEALLDAYRASARITSERKQELERELARRSSS